MHRIAPLVFALLFVLASPAHAADGVVEINRAAVLAGGITPSDTPGFPATLDRRGSYRLTGNLSVPANVDGIRITADGVSLDLGGFSITGPTIVICPIGGCPPNQGTGVDASGAQGVTVRNGVVENMGRNGIELQGNGYVEEVVARSNDRHGIDAGFGSLVRHCIVERNGLDGVILSGSANAIGNTMIANGGEGLHCSTSNGRTCGYALNVFGLNSGQSADPADQVLGGIQTGGNVCGTTLCP